MNSRALSRHKASTTHYSYRPLSSKIDHFDSFGCTKCCKEAQGDLRLLGERRNWE